MSLPALIIINTMSININHNAPFNFLAIYFTNLTDSNMREHTKAKAAAHTVILLSYCLVGYVPTASSL